MIQSILEFFKREKLYAILFILVGLTYGYAAVTSRTVPRPFEDSSALRQFEQAQKIFEEKMKDPQALKHFSVKNSPPVRLFEGLSLLFMGVIALGLFIEFLVFFVPSLRQKIAVAEPPSRVSWRVGMITKVVLLFLSSAFALTVLLGILKIYFFRGLSENFFLLSHTIMTDFLCVFFILRVVRPCGGSWRDLGLRVPSGKALWEVGYGWLGYAGILPFFWGALLLVVMISNLFSYQPTPHPLVTIFLEEESSSLMVIYSVVIATVLGPVIEEIFFRGFCYTVFKARYGKAAAMILSASLFSLIHANTFAFWPIFVLGLGLAYLYELRKSLLPSMVLHITHNALFISYFFLMKYVISRYVS